MEKYEILGQVGEGSFGQVFKAKIRGSSEIVAIKIIRKKGRSAEELTGLRQECEIQRLLHHPNIVQMIESFEDTEEVFVVTEYANNELYELLRREKHFPEERARKIVCHLVSALYYLHSNRVLHRDLKPQNVLLEANGLAKLCDFGFATSMGTGTHVLTSIKGTPLYMAPELIEECPYDHNVDLWSLGCIAYEMLVGRPPFQTTAIGHLVELIRFGSIEWPKFISPVCQSFLQGLLQKDPSRRLTWPELLHHPFVKDDILIMDKATPTSLTTPLSASQAIAKQQQLENLSMRSIGQTRVLEKTINKIQDQKHFSPCISQPRCPIVKGFCQPCHQPLGYSEPSGTDSTASVNVHLGNLSHRTSLQSDLFIVDKDLCKIDSSDKSWMRPSNFVTHQLQSQQQRNNNKKKKSGILSQSGELNRYNLDFVDEKKFSSENHDENLGKELKLPDWDAITVDQHIENEEWVAFLQRSMEEVIEGEIASLIEETCVSVFVSPLRNSAASCQVIEYIACLLSLPFAVPICQEDLHKIQKVYYDVNVVPNLVYAIKLIIMKDLDYKNDQDNSDCYSDRGSIPQLSPDQLQALEYSILFLCRLVYVKEQFLTQFCDAVKIIHGIPFLQQLFGLEKRKARIVADLLAIFNNILRLQPENAYLIENVVFGAKTSRQSIEQLSKLLTHRQNVFKRRVCTLIRLMGRLCVTALKQVWGKQLRNLMEMLTHDENNGVKSVAKNSINELKQLIFYNQECPEEE